MGDVVAEVKAKHVVGGFALAPADDGAPLLCMRVEIDEDTSAGSAQARPRVAAATVFELMVGQRARRARPRQGGKKSRCPHW